MADFTFVTKNPSRPRGPDFIRRFDRAPGVTAISVSQIGMEVMYIATVPPSLDVVNRCDHCGRGDLKEQIAHSVDQAVQFGWLVEVEK